jgi:hypothetical protein
VVQGEFLESVSPVLHRSNISNSTPLGGYVENILKARKRVQRDSAICPEKDHGTFSTLTLAAFSPASALTATESAAQECYVKCGITRMVNLVEQFVMGSLR